MLPPHTSSTPLPDVKVTPGAATLITAGPSRYRLGQHANSQSLCGRISRSAPRARQQIADPKQALNVMDFELAARSVLPPAHFGYLATGVEDDLTLKANRDGFSRLHLRPKRLIDITRVDMRGIVRQHVGYAHRPGSDGKSESISCGRRDSGRQRLARREVCRSVDCHEFLGEMSPKLSAGPSGISFTPHRDGSTPKACSARGSRRMPRVGSHGGHSGGRVDGKRSNDRRASTSAIVFPAMEPLQKISFAASRCFKEWMCLVSA